MNISDFKMTQGRFANGINVKPNRKTFLVIDNVTSVEDKSRLYHCFIDLAKIQIHV